MPCRSVVAGIILSAFVILPNSWAQSTGTLVVQVAVPAIDSPVGFLVVAVLSVPDAQADFSGPRVFPAITDPSGSVSFSGLPFGMYSVCAEPQDGLHVDNCRWAPPDRVHLTSQSPSGTLNLTLRRGVAVDIRIDDPDSLLSSSNAFVEVGVDTPRGHQHLFPIAQDPSGANYRVIAPFSVAAAVEVVSTGFHIVDATGQDFVPTSAAAAFNFASTDVSKFFRFTLRKRN
jgi:hypothetical protein